MLFNSFHFLAFFAIVTATYYALPSRYRWILLLVASYYFYMCWNIPFTGLLMATTLLDYAAARLIETTTSISLKRTLLLTSLCLNLGVLFTFKYANFALGSLESLFHAAGSPVQFGSLALILPLGISFYTFQSISYVVDVYRGETAAERHLGYYATYIIFFPQLVAGPIERCGNLLPQFRWDKHFRFEDVRAGLQLMLWGILKKMLVADTAAAAVNEIFRHPRDFSGPAVFFGAWLFGIQVYCDFSGYSDVARGSARVLGFRLMENFRRPFFARSMAEFWSRWHLSLTSWFRDYVYFPLGGNRVTRWRYCFNVVFTFLLSGLWHGAAWTFVLWGGFNGVILVIAKETAQFRKKVSDAIGLPSIPFIYAAWQRLAVAGLFTTTLLFFRSPTVGDAFYVLRHALDFNQFRVVELVGQLLPKVEMALLLGMIFGLFAIEYVWEKDLASRAWNLRPFRWTAYVTGLYALVFFGVFRKIEFVYFQF